MPARTTLRDYAKVFWNTVKSDRRLLVVVIVYSTIASVFNVVLPLSIQYIASQIIASASAFPIVVITLCLLVFLGFYATLKAFQVIVFSYFEKQFFVRQAYSLSYAAEKAHLPIRNEDLVQTYTEISNAVTYIGNFIFVTSMLIQQFVMGLIITAFYHFSFLLFNIILFIVIFVVFKVFFLRSITQYRRELDIRYSIGHNLQKPDVILPLLSEYYKRKTTYFETILTQNIIFLFLYVASNGVFLFLSGFLTLKGYITIPQFLASEIIFSLVFVTLGEFAKNLKNMYELLNATKKMHEVIHCWDSIPVENLNIPPVPNFYTKLIKIIGIFLFVFFAGLFIIPWYQTSRGTGRIIAYNQDDRPQDITTMVSGRITKWYANDGQLLKVGEKIAEISDNDPDLLLKLESEVESVKMQYENAQLTTSTAKINYDRQSELYKQGLTARKDYEKAKIEYQKNLVYENEIKAKFIQTDVKLARQKSQVVVAPKDGYLLQSKSKSTSSYVYAGEVIASFVPQIEDPVIELFVSPNDIPLIHVNRKVRIQIEGWPALRISGWPATSLGTFGGVVKIVDSAISSNGMFRVIVMPDPDDTPWPDMKYIKQGTKVAGWVRMNKVSIGYEIWRQMNGFPIQPDEPLFLHYAKK
jgi:hypothetical protein